MVSLINSAGTNIVTHKSNGIVVGMPESSLERHLRKHPDIAKTPQTYLEQSTRVLRYGRPYDNGMLHEGIFCRAYDSPEVGLKMVCTVHRRLN